jgi:hypothetical protein
MNALHMARETAIPRNMTLKQARNLLKKNQSLVRRLEQKILSMKSKKKNKNQNNMNLAKKPVNVMGMLNGLAELGFLGGGRQTRKQKH